MPVRKKNCNCRNSRCLKLYCECFASGLHCERCNCTNCCNNLENAAVRQEAVEATLERNPNAFRPKIAPNPGAEEETEGVGRHNKGCHCKKSSCLKKYCECFQANIFCSDICRCVDCKNFEGSSQRALTAAKAARQLPSTSSPRRNLTSTRDAVAQPSGGKVAGDDYGLPLEGNAATLGTLQSKIALAVASTRQPYLNQVVSKGDVDELSQSLLMVSDEAKRKRLQASAVQERISDLPRMQEAGGRETKKSKAEEDLSPGTKALLCDEGDNMFTHTSSLTARDNDSIQTHNNTSSTLVEREKSVMAELTKNIKKIASVRTLNYNIFCCPLSDVSREFFTGPAENRVGCFYDFIFDS